MLNSNEELGGAGDESLRVPHKPDRQEELEGDVRHIAKTLAACEKSVANRSSVGQILVRILVTEPVEAAHQAGADFSVIPDFEKRYEKLLADAPLAEVERSLVEIDKLDKSSDDGKIAASDWYWKAREVLVDSADKIPQDKDRALRERLAKIAAEIDVDETIPIEPISSPEPHDNHPRLQGKIILRDERAKESLTGLIDRFESLSLRYDLMSAAARNNLPRLPKIAVVDEILRSFDASDKAIASRARMLRGSFDDTQGILGALPDGLPLPEAVNDRVRSISQLMDTFKEELDKLERRLVFIPLYSRG